MPTDRHDPCAPPSPPLWARTHLAEVVSVDDPDRQGRVQLRLSTCDGLPDHDAPIWARVAVPFAGPDYGAFFLPGVGDEVVVQFVNGDPRRPLVVGSIWHGAAAPPEALDRDAVESWTLVGRRGTRIAIDEKQSGSVVKLSTVSGVAATLTDEGGGRIKLEANGTTVEMTPSNVEVTAPGTVKVQASMVEVSAGMVTVDAAMAKFSGIVQCTTLMTSTCIASTYTPGAGNVW